MSSKKHTDLLTRVQQNDEKTKLHSRGGGGGEAQTQKGDKRIILYIVALDIGC